jgi:hypothetical protein
MCPILANEGLFAFIIPSPKQDDLRRDGRFALHSFPRPDNEDAFYLSGRVRLVEDRVLRQLVGERFVLEREQFNVPPPAAEDLLVEFEISQCLLTITSGHGDPTPSHTIWLE